MGSLWAMGTENRKRLAVLGVGVDALNWTAEGQARPAAWVMSREDARNTIHRSSELGPAGACGQLLLPRDPSGLSLLVSHVPVSHC